MGDIVYLLGAGASCGMRGKEPQTFTIKRVVNNRTDAIINNCVEILEGLPIVSEIPNRLSYVWVRCGKLLTNLAKQIQLGCHFSN